MFSRPSPVGRCLVSFAAVVLVMPCAVLPVTAQQATNDAPDVERTRSASEAHVQQRIEEILERARTGLKRVNHDVQDYRCILIKQEQVEGKLQAMQFMRIKVRHEQRDGDEVTVPFSVYVKFLKPARLAGREVIYVKGANNGDLIARRGGRRRANMTVELDPDCPLAMEGNRYPITEIGFATLVRRLIEVMEKDIEPDNCDIRRFDNAKQDGRHCTHFELSLLQKKAGAQFMRAHVFVDEEYRLPTFYAAYDWPDTEGGKPVLLEAYTYRNIEVNVGLTDKDFDRNNPEYHFANTESVPDDEGS